MARWTRARTAASAPGGLHFPPEETRSGIPHVLSGTRSHFARRSLSLTPLSLCPKAWSFRPKARAPLDCPSMDSPPSGPRSARAFEHGRKKVCCRPSEPPAHAARARHAQNRWVLGPVVGAATGPSTHRAHPAPPAREHRAQPRSSVAHRAAPRASPRASPWARPRCSPCAHLVQASVVGAALPPPPLSSSSSSSSSSTC